MGLAWQQGPLSPQAVGRFLVADPLPERLLFAEPLRRRMRVRFGGQWIADSENVVVLHEPGRYPVAYFPREDIAAGVLERSEHTSEHRDLGRNRVVRRQRRRAERSARRLGARRRCPAMPASSPTTSRSRGGRWKPSTKRTSESSATRPTDITASTYDEPLGGWWFAAATRSSPRRRGRWSSTSPGLRRAGTSPATTSTSRGWRPTQPRRSARTRAFAAITTSAAPAAPHGHTTMRTPKSTGSRRLHLLRAGQGDRGARRPAAGARAGPDRGLTRHRPGPQRERGSGRRVSSAPRRHGDPSARHVSMPRRFKNPD